MRMFYILEFLFSVVLDDQPDFGHAVVTIFS